MIRMRVPLLDLRAQYDGLRGDMIAAVTEVLDSQVYIGGPKIAELERQVAALSGCEHAVAVSSGTDALLACLMALRIGPGDEVITSPFTFFATAGSIARIGARPVFADIDPRTFNIDPTAIERAITPRTRAIIPVHLFGQVCDMDAILEVAARNGLPVIEDAAQAIGATYKRRPAGSFGTAGCLSFYPSKNLGAAGDGGMVVTRDEALAARLAVMRNHGMQPRYFYRFIGANFRLDAVQAAVLLVKLPHLQAWSEARRRNAEWYNQRFAGSAVRTPYVDPDCASIYNQYVVRLARRDEAVEFLKARGIGTDIYYPLPLHMQDCFRYLGYSAGDFPHAEAASREVLALPVYPEMTPEQREWVASALLDFCAAGPQAEAANA